MFILYKITYIPLNSFYYGIVVKQGKSIEDRFSEHMTGKGSLEISKLIESGATESDFIIELLEELPLIDQIHSAEVEAIQSAKIRGEKLLNANGGGGFVGKKFFYNSSYYLRGWDVNVYHSKKKNTDIQNIIELSCTNIQSYKKIHIKRKNSCKFVQYIEFLLRYSDILYKIGKHYKWTKIFKILSKFTGYTIEKCFSSYDDSEKLFKYLDNITGDKDIFKFNHACEQYYVNSQHVISTGRNTEDLFFAHFFESNHANIFHQFKEMYGTKINSPSDTLGWELGRENFRDRIAAGIKTDKEIIAIKERSDIITNAWSQLSEDEVKLRTKSGLASMNSNLYICEKCKKPNLTKGNLVRWHNEKCKGINV